MELAAVAEVPGLEVVRVDAAARKWTWFHETYTISVAAVPMHVEWPGRYRQAVR
jgi:hypothetical protein